MALTYRRKPASNGILYTAWTASAGNKWECVDDIYGSEDDDTTYISAINALDRYNARMPVMDASITSFTNPVVEVRVRNLTGAGTYVRFSLFFNAVESAQADAAMVNTNYANFASAAYAKPGGGAWTLADLSNSGAGGYELGIYSAGAGVTKRCTRLNDMFTVEMAAGGFVAYVGGIVGPLIALGAYEMGGLADHLRRATNLCFDIPPSSYDQYYRVLTEWRYPVHFLMGA